MQEHRVVSVDLEIHRFQPSELPVAVNYTAKSFSNTRKCTKGNSPLPTASTYQMAHSVFTCLHLTLLNDSSEYIYYKFPLKKSS